MKNKNVNLDEAAVLRKKAEERLKKQKPERSLPFSKADALKLIHELEVNKIELEMQNEELIYAKHKIEELANEKYKELYDFAPSGYLSISKEGDILELNFAAARMLGKERSNLINNRFALFISQETLTDFNLFIEKVFTGKTKQTCEVVIVTEGILALAEPIDVKIDGIINQNDEFCLLTLIDITERKQAEQALKESERNLQLKYEEYEAINKELLQTNNKLLKAKEKDERAEIELKKAQKIAHLGSWYLDLETNEVVWTEELYKMYGFDPTQPVPPYTEHMKLFTPESWEILSTSLAKTRETGIPYELELKTIRKDDSNGWMWVRGEAIFDEGKKIIGLWGAAQDITERKQAEEKLKTSDRIFKHSLDMLCIAGFDGYLKVINPAWTKILGWSNEELLSKPWIDFVHPNDRDNTKDIKTVIVDGKEIYQFENRYMCKDGTIKWLSWNSFPYHEENIMFGVARDVTVSKQRELTINNFFERPLNLNLIADFEGTINRANSAWEIYLGYKKDEITGRNFFDFIHPDDISTTIEEMKNLEKGIATFHFENRYRHKNGEYRKLAWSSITSLDEHLVYAVAIDITEKQQAEEALRKSEAIKNAMVSNIGDVIVIIDHNGINQYKSPNITKLFGWKPDELTGKSIWNTIHPDDLEAAQKFINTIATEPNATGTTEVRYKRKDGKFVWIEISVINLLHDKDIQGILGNYSDITERKQAEQIRQQLDITQKTVMFKQNFLANMSHEIRTPLTGVLGMIDILNQTQLSEEQQDYLNIIKTSGKNLSEIINQVLDYSKIEAGKVSLNPVTFQFSTLIHDTVNLYKNSMKSGVKLSTHSNIQIPLTIKADRLRLSQVINNLVSNALKFTREGSVTIRSTLVTLNTQTHEMVIKVEVADTGIGIPASLQKELFVPFSQIDASDLRKYEGTGLGLAICKQLVELMGGEIGLTSQEGKGSTFWFTFPASIDDQQPKPEAKHTGILSQKNLRILLVEDKLVNQKVIKLMLTSMGQTVTIACNGKRAMELYQPGKFDLILMDIQMPVMDGVTATQKLKEIYDDLPPIVGLSANAFEGDREKYMDMGMDEYLTKPVKKDDFEELISRLIE